MNESAEWTPQQNSQDRSVLTHRRLLGERLYFQTWVRLLVAFVVGSAALFGRNLQLFDPEAIGGLTALAIVIATYDVGAWTVFRRYRGPQESAAANRMLQNTMFGTIVLDYLALTVFLWLTGGARSPFIPFFLLHLVLSHLLLSRNRAMSAAGLASFLLVALVVSEGAGLLTTHTPFGSAQPQPERSLTLCLIILAVYGTLFALTSFFMLDLTGKLREREIRLHWAHAEAERLSNLRKDFVRIAMHNLRAPVGAVTMMLGNLHAGLGGPVTEKQDVWVRRILARLEGLSTFLHDLQMLSVLDNQALVAQHDEVDLRPLLQSLVDEHQDLAEEKGHELTLELPAELPTVRGIGRLLREAVVNYITNAIKYTPTGGHIRVRADQSNGSLRIAVEDDGPGIPQKDQVRLFNEFVRIGKQQDPQAGSGLGLFIVKRVAEAHGGSARVESKEGAGSTFTLELPLPKTEGEANGS